MSLNFSQVLKKVQFCMDTVKSVLPPFHSPPAFDFRNDPIRLCNSVKEIRQVDIQVPSDVLKQAFLWQYNQNFEVRMGEHSLDLGFPVSLVCSIEAVYIGSHLGIVYKFQYEKDMRSIKIFGKEMTFKRYGPALYLALNARETLLACGFCSGHISIFSTLNGQLFTTIKQHRSRIQGLKFLQSQCDQNNKLISCDKQGLFVLSLFKDKDLTKIFGSKYQARPILPNTKLISTFELFGKENKPSPINCRIAVPSRQILKDFRMDERTIAILRGDTLQILYFNFDLTLKRIEIIQSELQAVGLIDFGRGGFGRSTNSFLLLVLSVGKELMVFRFIEQEEQDNLHWHLVNKQVYQRVIITGGFISNNLLIILDDEAVLLSQVGEQPIRFVNFNISKFEYLNFFNDEWLREGQSYQLELQQVLHGIICLDQQNSSLVCVQGKRVILGLVKSWRAYLEDFVRKQEWQLIVKLILRIYRGELRLLSDIPERQQDRAVMMNQFIQTISITYLSYSKIDSETLGVLAWLCQESGQQKFYLEVIYQIAIERGHQQVYLKVLSNQVLSKQLNFLNSKVLQELILSERGAQLVEAIATNPRMQLQDYSLLAKMAYQKDLFRPMMYLSQKLGDFLTPILKIQATLLCKGSGQGSSLLLWYLFYCLYGFNIHREMVSQAEYQVMVSDILAYLLDRNNIFPLFELLGQPFLYVLQLLFEHPYVHVIEKIVNRLKITDREVDGVQSVASQGFVRTILKNILTILMPLHKNNKGLKRWLVRLAVQEKIKFSNEIVVELIKYCSFHRLQGQFCKLMEICNPQFPSWLQGYIQSYQEEESMPVVILHFYFLKKRYSKCMSVLQAHFKEKLIDFLEEVGMSRLTEDDKNQFREAVIQKAGHYLQIFKEQKNRYFKVIFEAADNFDEALLKSLRQHPKCLVDSIEYQLERNQSHVRDDIKLQYIRLLCQKKKDEVLNKLRQYQFPLEDTLSVLKEFQKDSFIKEAMAYLYERQGHFKSAILIWTDLFMGSYKSAVQAILKNQNFDKAALRNRQVSLMNLYIKQRQESVVDDWFYFLDKFFKDIKLQQNLTKQKIPEAIKSLLKEMVALAVEVTFQYLDQSSIYRFFDTYKSMPAFLIRPAFLDKFDNITCSLSLYSNLNIQLFSFVQNLRTQIIRRKVLFHFRDVRFVGRIGLS